MNTVALDNAKYYIRENLKRLTYAIDDIRALSSNLSLAGLDGVASIIDCAIRNFDYDRKNIEKALDELTEESLRDKE